AQAEPAGMAPSVASIGRIGCVDGSGRLVPSTR
ncbi:MAG: hypothetical protein QOI75_2314, partial [Pseudonocardiales bacterium]|nr:hypothetical protein [Pseudonocardiales bacterium]